MHHCNYYTYTGKKKLFWLLLLSLFSLHVCAFKTLTPTIDTAYRQHLQWPMACDFRGVPGLTMLKGQQIETVTFEHQCHKVWLQHTNPHNWVVMWLIVMGFQDSLLRKTNTLTPPKKKTSSSNRHFNLITVH